MVQSSHQCAVVNLVSALFLVYQNNTFIFILFFFYMFLMSLAAIIHLSPRMKAHDVRYEPQISKS